MNTTRQSGNGDPCPQDPEHGLMWFNSPTRQWCPNARHKGSAFYNRDGTTPASRSVQQPASPTPPTGLPSGSAVARPSTQARASSD